MIAIDLGSNTLRIVQFDCTNGQYLNSYEKIVKTADNLAATGIVSDAAVQRVIEGIEEAKTQFDFSSVPVKAVTTEAIRRAQNALDVLAQIKRRTGIGFEVISGDEEARLTLLAVKHRLAKLRYASEKFVLVDIGGGSTELVFNYGDETISKSFPVGIVTIAQTYQALEKIEESLQNEMLPMQRFCAEVFATKGEINAFVATAGTPTTVAAMKLGQTYASYDAAKINGTSLNIQELDVYLKKLLAMPFEQCETTVGTGRSDLIAAGILIFKQLFKLLEAESCIVVDDGLREGVALEGCKKHRI